jgi:hydroxyethylthiazole kinase-like uncharacterized protein yjeF
VGEAPDRPVGMRTVPVLIGGDEMARIDEAAQRLGLTQDALMESAGAAVAELAHAELVPLTDAPDRPAGDQPLVVVLCGPGNNGGAMRSVAARHNWTVLQSMASAGALELFVAPTPEMLVALRERLAHATLLVDALLGSGGSGRLREPVATAVQLVNAVRTHAVADGRACSVLAVDTPTRIDLTTGVQSDPVIAADLTVTFHRAKAGFALDPEARRLAGRYFVAPIGIPLEAEEGIVPPDGEFPPARIAQITWGAPAS